MSEYPYAEALNGHETVRVIRVLEYVGPRATVENTLEHNHVKGTRHIGEMIIREAVLGDFPEVLERSSDSEGENA